MAAAFQTWRGDKREPLGVHCSVMSTVAFLNNDFFYDTNSCNGWNE